MKIEVKLFAVARQIADRDSIELELAENSTVADARRALAAHVPALAALLPNMLFAVGTNYATDRTPLSSENPLACIPPVSGG